MRNAMGFTQTWGFSITGVRHRLTVERNRYADAMARRVAADKTENGLFVPRGMADIGDRCNWLHRMLRAGLTDAQLAERYAAETRDYPVWEP